MDTEIHTDKRVSLSDTDTIVDWGYGRGTDNDSRLRIVAWNIEGIKSKLKDQDIIQYLNGFDIFSLLETWTINTEDMHVHDMSSMISNPNCNIDDVIDKFNVVLYKNVAKRPLALTEEFSQNGLMRTVGHNKYNKNVLLRKFRRHRTDENLNLYAKREFKTLCDSKQASYNHRMLNDLISNSQNPKSF